MYSAMRLSLLAAMASLSLGLSGTASAAPAATDVRHPNVLLFTADDMHCQSLESFGGKVAGLTPNLDRFAAEGMRFERAHVNVAICQPSRGVLATGRYGHNSGILGFMHTRRDIPTIMETLREAGYRTGILGKVDHSTPKADYRWDFVHDFAELGNGRSPQRYYGYAKEFFAQCRESGQPFYFMVNSHDPHRPYHVPGRKYGQSEEPSRTYSPSEVEVPGFVPDLPGVREELYDLEKDPDCLHNLVDSPQHQEVLQRYRRTLRDWMVRTGDPLLGAFDHRDDRQVVNATIREYTRGSRKIRQPRRPTPGR